MKKIITLTIFLCALVASAQFASNTTSLGSTGMSVKLETNATTATLTLMGSSTSYLAIGFGNAGMGNGTDGFIYTNSNNVDYTFSGVGNTPTVDANQNWSIVSNTVASGTRTIVATRTLAGGAEDYTLSNAAVNIPISYAKGTSATLANHGANRGYSTLVMTALASNNEFESQVVKLFPNPTTDILNFTSSASIQKIHFYDITGKLIKTIAPNETRSVDISNFEKGTYILEFELSEQGKHYEKIIKK